VAVQHGLPGTVEVEVERVPPAVLVMRAVGYALALGDTKPQPVPAVNTSVTVTAR
jgi:hypothetical protein